MGEDKAEIAHANDKGSSKNSAQGVPCGEAATVEVVDAESCSLCIAMC